MAKSLDLWLDKIDQAIARIERYLEDHDFESFCDEQIIQDATERNLQNIAEAIKIHIPETEMAKEPEIPWKDWIKFGDFLRHQYHRTDPCEIWKTCTRDLAPLKVAIARIRESLERERDR